MPQDDFQQECDRLSDAVDAGHFERFRWERDEAPKLERLVELVQSSFAGRRDFDLAEEGATHGFKKYVLKVHSNRTVAITVKLEKGHAVLAAEEIDRSPYTLSETGAVGTKYENVDERWIAAALKTLFGRICAPNTEAE
jgi:hypothetical protein